MCEHGTSDVARTLATAAILQMSRQRFGRDHILASVMLALLTRLLSDSCDNVRYNTYMILLQLCSALAGMLLHILHDGRIWLIDYKWHND
jgi:hypothetical protein